MILDPTDHTTSPASQSFLEIVRVKAPALAAVPDDDLLDLAARIASLGYLGHLAEVWRVGRSLGWSDHDFGVVVRETFTTLYPIAIVIPR